MPGKIRKIDENRWEVPQSFRPGMRVPGIVYADDSLMRDIRDDQALEQVANVACLPGIVKASIAMPDIHWGYGFPIGGVAATRVKDGVVSPGGVGFDINCGVRLLRTDLMEADVRPRLDELVTNLFNNVPSGVGSSGKVRLSAKEIEQVMRKGGRWAVEQGWGDADDLEVTEESGTLAGSQPDLISKRARERGAPQLGTLGSGNHFLEVQAVETIYDADAASAMGIEQIGQVTILIHCGSRGLGHQVCDDYLKVMDAARSRYGIELPDRQLACAPVESKEGRDYLASLACAANFAWANRQCIAHWTRQAFEQVFGQSWRRMGMRQVYDVAHNIAKIERHTVDGKSMRVCVHRKGATRSFPPGHAEIPARYREVGQPVLIPGDMGRYSFLAVGVATAMEETFGSTCHGAGRLKSRSAARRELKGRDIAAELREQGIVVRAASRKGLLEEASMAYKDVAHVIDVAEAAGLVKKVAKMRPLGVVKG